MPLLGTIILSTVLAVGPDRLPEQPRVEDLVRELVGAETRTTYQDEMYGQAIPLPVQRVRRATLIVLSENERRCTFTFDEKGRTVLETKHGPFDGPTERETSYEYGPYGLVRRTSNGTYFDEPYEWAGEYDDRGRLIGSESRGGHTGSRSTMVSRSPRDDEVLIFESHSPDPRLCTDVVHRIEVDPRGRVARHVVVGDSGSFTARDYETDDDHQVLRVTRSYSPIGPTFSDTIERNHEDGVTVVAGWGSNHELITLHSIHTLGSGCWSEFENVSRNERWVYIFDAGGLRERTIFVGHQDVPAIEAWQHTSDAFGNLLECRRNTLAAGRSHAYLRGYRWEVEYLPPK